MKDASELLTGHGYVLGSGGIMLILSNDLHKEEILCKFFRNKYELEMWRRVVDKNLRGEE